MEKPTKDKQLILADACKTNENNLNFIRFVASLLVICSHSVSLTQGSGHNDILSYLSKNRISLGSLAVSIFFFYSGFFICSSALRSQSAAQYLKKRIIRIIPPLIFVTFVITFIAGPILTSLSLSAYFSHTGTYKYLLNSVLIPIHDLPGVFENNIYNSTVNGALWTLPIEFACYIGCFIFMKTGFLDKQWGKYTTIPVLILYLIGENLLSRYNPLFAASLRPVFLFYLGMICYTYREKIKLDYKYFLGASVLLFLSLLWTGFSVFFFAAFPYSLLWLGFGTTKKLSSFGKKYEISYGIYLCGFPIQQTLVYISQNTMKWYTNILLAIPLAIISGFVVFYCSERPLIIPPKVY